MRTRVAYLPALLFLFVFGIGNLLADGLPAIPMPPENPEGNSGALRPQVVTGGSYDIHSGNASRIINDLHVPGALGTYGLDFTRYWNSVHNEDTNSAADWPMDFGYSGWSHSWRWSAVLDWEVPDPENGGSATSFITSITITFPDGHATKFKLCRTTGYPWGEGRIGPPYYADHFERDWPLAGEGVHDHLAEMAQDGSEFFIYLADGGSVHFVGYNGANLTGENWLYRATEVYDPHGLRTTLSYTDGLLTRVADEGNRWLNIQWKRFSNYAGAVIGIVETGGDAGSQHVFYKYSFVGDGYVLAAVSYADTPAPGQVAVASYTYGHSYQGDQPGVGPQSFFPILKRADDPHFAGAMTKIFYNYYGREDCRPPNFVTHPPPVGYFDWFWFSPDAIAEELSDGATGWPVSRFPAMCRSATRTEYNGFGGERIFYFGRSANDGEINENMGYQLTKVTDFAFPNPNVVPFRKQNGPEPTKVWDGRNIKTTLDYYDTGQPSAIHYIDGSNCLYDRVDAGNGSGSLAPDPNRMHNQQHHWLFKKTDENGNITVYRRDERRRVTNISYYDAWNNLLASEGYSYNEWNQVTSHTLPSGAVQHYEYDGYHRLQKEDNSVDFAISSSDFKFYTYYGPGNHPEWADLVEMVIDGRARVSGVPFTVKMTYNGRQQVMSEEYPGTGGSAHPTVRYEYDKYGNRTAIINELGERQDFTYDSYRRCTSRTEWVLSSGGDCPSLISRRWDWFYNRVIDYGPPNGQTDHPPSSHTSKEWSAQVEPVFNSLNQRRVTARVFDVNNRIVSEQTGLIQPPGPIGPDNPWFSVRETETHRFTYDENGQKSSSTDSIGVTTYAYDNRNRLETTTEPKRQDQQDFPVTRLEYDRAGNKTKVTFPDLTTQRWEDYDPFGQPRQFFDERNNVTDLTYHWGPMKKLDTVRTYRRKDNPPEEIETQETNFEYDGMGRPQWTVFPDASSELSVYELGQLSAFKTRKGQTKRLHYDARGREDYHTWDGGAAPRIDRIWDDAGRLTRISNNFSIIDYTYDEAGQVETESTTVTGDTAARIVRYCRYPSGDVSRITYPNGTIVDRNYTSRGQLEGVGWGSGSTSYAYLRDGRVDYQARSNGVTTSYGYDGRGMIGSLQHTKDGRDLARRDYWRDDRDRILAWKRGSDNYYNAMEDGRGDRYHYDPEGQLDLAAYRVANPETSPGVPQRSDEFHYDALGNRMGSNRVASRGSMNFTRRDNGLNQYSGWWPYSPIYHDDNIPAPPPTNPPGPPFPWVFPGNGVVMQDGWITAGYNALNQPICIWSPMYPGGPSAPWMWFGYDPLGRCVKRWVGPSGTSANNPTYYYYDGWSLIQEGPSGGTADRVYVHGGRVDEIVASQAGGVWSYHQYDAQGNCILLTDASGGIREQYDYDAFGMPYFYNAAGVKVGSSAQWGNRFLFTGREWLKDLKVYDYRNRMYQPELGRFLQPDPKEFAAGDYNLYRYCHNDPINRTDPMGLQVEKEEEKKLVREVFKTTYSPTGTHLSVTIRYTESGNWNNTKIADHYKAGMKGGSTKAEGTAKQSGLNWNIDLHVDWFVGNDDKNSDVVTRELEHVQDFRNFSAAYARSLSGNVSPAMFSQQVREKGEESRNQYDGSIAQQISQGAALDKTHNLSMYPKVLATLPVFEDTASKVPYNPTSDPRY